MEKITDLVLEEDRKYKQEPNLKYLYSKIKLANEQVKFGLNRKKRVYKINQIELEKNKKILEHHRKTRIIPFNKNGINLSYYHKINDMSISFKTRDEFLDMIKNGELLEYAEFVGNFYGTPKKFVLDKINNGHNVLLEIEMQGALQVKKIFSDAKLIFIAIPSLEELKNRLKNRGRETDEDIIKRIKQAKVDISYADKYDYIVMNDDIDKVIDYINTMDGETLRDKFNTYFINCLGVSQSNIDYFRSEMLEAIKPKDIDDSAIRNIEYNEDSSDDVILYDLNGLRVLSAINSGLYLVRDRKGQTRKLFIRK